MGSVQSMASSSPSTVPSSDRTSHFSSQTESEMESSKTRHWSQLDYPTTDSESSAEANSKYFALLKKDPKWGRFFKDFVALEVGEKISGGAQADIYEARNRCDGPFYLVVKVMKGDAPLRACQAQWPIGMLSARSKYKHLFDLPLITILGGTMLRDQRLRGRFGFVMYRRWGDLRLLIDRRMKQKRSTPGPFPLDEAIHLMLRIAEDMDALHNKHDVLHRDLKASNVLVWGGFGEDMSLVDPLNRLETIESVVADFECSVGVLGTGFWRASEILEQLKDRVSGAEVLFTHASDVYSYGMTCYEIVTGGFPYDGLGGKDISISSSQVLQGRRPELPRELPEFVRNIITACWHSDPLERPTFSAICEALKQKRSPDPLSVVIDNRSQRGASIVKVEKWKKPQALTLLEGMQKLMDMNLSVLKARDLSSTIMIMQYFEVTNCEGKKVMDDKSIANITEALSLLVMDRTKCISESLETSRDGNSTPQITHIVEVVADRSAGLLGALSRLLEATNFQVMSAGCRTRNGQVECVIYMEGTRIETLLRELRRNYMEYFPSSTQGRFKTIGHRVATKKFSHLNGRLHDLKSMDFTFPYRSSSIHVHQRKESKESFCSTKVVVCLEERESLVDVSRTLEDMNYKIVGASVEYLGPSEFLKGKVNKTRDIDVGTLGEDESRKIQKIMDIATERGRSQGNGQLIISGPDGELHDDLMRCLRQNDLVVTGSNHGWEFGTGFSAFPLGYLDFFVTKKSTARAKFKKLFGFHQLISFDSRLLVLVSYALCVWQISLNSINWLYSMCHFQP